MMSNRTRSLDPFRPVDEVERQAHVSRYAAFLAERDGGADFAGRKLARRDERLREIALKSHPWSEGMDLEGFTRAFQGEHDVEIDELTEWLVAAAKSCEGETYGVELEIDRYERTGGFVGLPDDAEPPLAHILLQEHYHCSTLREICDVCNLQVTFKKPGIANRIMMAVIGCLPGTARWIPVLAGEAVGAEVFRVLHDRCDVFSAEPDVGSRLQALVREIWIDEVLHVAFFRAHLGPWSLRAARWLVPVIAAAVFRDVPLLEKIGLTSRQIQDGLKNGVAIPAEVAWEL